MAYKIELDIQEHSLKGLFFRCECVGQSGGKWPFYNKLGIKMGQEGAVGAFRTAACAKKCNFFKNFGTAPAQKYHYANNI